MGAVDATWHASLAFGAEASAIHHAVTSLQ